ncbi:uncharacterized protein [Amphiura filiformis]|uniref:uncharacterized protein n=1 Tax=Amphiura filiformis TaxID=82378 RepID=UPI003B20F65C
MRKPFLWSEERVGGVEGISGDVYEEANKILIQAEQHLLDLFNRPSRRNLTEYTIAQYRIRTDPLAGYHYFLFKIDTGENWYIHIQLKMSTNPAKRDTVLQACLGGQNAQSPLLQIQVSSPDNMCRLPVKRIPYVSAAVKLNQLSAVLTVIVFWFIKVILLKSQ